ncbi:uncharacterized protein LOC124383798 [Silurus meridionalis]|uniref:uncharacterized protein LOC124383798 n=1 Tax=Silurus meridionalis TaxID=175797 RepID=UPI001EEB3D4A|nr:uncharacterized protein LOC124383798 [Silurus meridionalis]
MRRILCIILCAIHLPILTYASVQYVPLGNKVTLPCDVYGDQRTLKWLHRNKDNELNTIFSIISGYTFHNKLLSVRKKITRNLSLEISPFTEMDTGTYVCQVCILKNKCTDGKPVNLLPQFALKAMFIIEGDQFSYSCRYNLNPKADWRFEALGENITISVNHKWTNEGVLFIPDVHPANAGKYSYWGETSTGQQRMCSVSLCVLTVRAINLTDSPQNCTLYCDVDVDADEDDLADVLADKWNISITGRVNKPRSFLSCRLLRNVLETNKFSLVDVTATPHSYASPSDAIPSSTADRRYSSRPPVAVLISMSALFFIIIALVIFLFVLRQRADRGSRGAHRHSEIYISLKDKSNYSGKVKLLEVV